MSIASLTNPFPASVEEEIEIFCKANDVLLANSIEHSSWGPTIAFPVIYGAPMQYCQSYSQCSFPVHVGKFMN